MEWKKQIRVFPDEATNHESLSNESLIALYEMKQTQKEGVKDSSPGLHPGRSVVWWLVHSPGERCGFASSQGKSKSGMCSTSWLNALSSELLKKIEAIFSGRPRVED